MVLLIPTRKHTTDVSLVSDSVFLVSMTSVLERGIQVLSHGRLLICFGVGGVGDFLIVSLSPIFLSRQVGASDDLDLGLAHELGAVEDEHFHARLVLAALTCMKSVPERGALPVHL